MNLKVLMIGILSTNILLFNSVSAYNPEELRRLRDTGNCPNCDLRGADLRGADLRGADLSGADLSGADLSGADLRGATLNGVDFSGANLSDVKK
jgi:uncharacterized protein YjbI with pentapeptide repeats